MNYLQCCIRLIKERKGDTLPLIAASLSCIPRVNEYCEKAAAEKDNRVSLS